MDFDLSDLKLGLVWAIVVAWAAVMLGVVCGTLLSSPGS